MTDSNTDGEPPARPQHERVLQESLMNMALLDPPRWGWTAAGGIGDVLTPHQRSRRRSTRVAFRRHRQRLVSEKATQRKPEASPANTAKSDAIATGGSLTNGDSRHAAFGSAAAVVDATAASGAEDRKEAPLPPNGTSINGQSEESSKKGLIDQPYAQKIDHAEQRRRRVQSLLGPGLSISSTNMAKTSGPEESNDNSGNAGRGFHADVNAMKDGKVDAYMYHRGREGQETRDGETGALLCDTSTMDTGHCPEEPKMIVNVTVQFPIGDSSLYKEIIQWNLASPSTQTPLLFAKGISEEYGLTFAQTLDLAESIEKQLNAHIVQSCGYNESLPTSDSYGNPKRHAQHTQHYFLYGEASEEGSGGTEMDRKSIQSRLKTTRSVSRQSSTVSVGSARRRGSDMSATSRQESLDPADLDDKVTSELARRCLEASKADILQKVDKGEGKLALKNLAHCHFCYKAKGACVAFGCGVEAHVYCDFHAKSRAGVTIGGESMPSHLDYCPICSLSCDCSRCCRRFQRLGMDFQRACEEQQCEVGNVVFDRLLERCLNPGRFRNAEDDARRNTFAGGVEWVNCFVRKPPATDFPREVWGSREMEAGSPADYTTIFTAEGKFPVPSGAEESQPTLELMESDGGSDVVEDGNVDHCHECKQHGNLLCCDFCPRAFHAKCIDNSVPQAAGSKWECHVCVAEKNRKDSLQLSGDSTMNSIFAAYEIAADEETDGETLRGLRVLSVILEMVRKLKEYDYGYVFSDPVDVEQVEGYSNVVEKPMDLGTIEERILSGYYKALWKGDWTFEKMASEILKDMELVWHNCFTFNFEGSAVYRMAAVHRRQMQYMMECSLNGLLSEAVKSDVSSFVEQCERAREGISSSKNGPGSLVKGNKIFRLRPRGKHKITVKGNTSGTAKAVAVLDPTSGRIVKVYSSAKNAIQAVFFLIGLGYTFELGSIKDFTIKTYFQRSSADPSILMFGCRWVFLEDLHGGRVKFEKLVSETVYCLHGDSKLVFRSIAEAAACPTFGDVVRTGKFRKELDSSLFAGAEQTKVGTREWGRPDVLGSGQTENGKSSSRSIATTEVSLGVATEKLFRDSSRFAKIDRLSNCVLTGFDSAAGAYEDFCKTYQSFSHTKPTGEMPSLQLFLAEILDKTSGLSGLDWVSNGHNDAERHESKGCLKSGVERNLEQSNFVVGTAGTDLRNADNMVTEAGVPNGDSSPAPNSLSELAASREDPDKMSCDSATTTMPVSRETQSESDIENVPAQGGVDSEPAMDVVESRVEATQERIAENGVVKVGMISAASASKENPNQGSEAEEDKHKEDDLRKGSNLRKRSLDKASKDPNNDMPTRTRRSKRTRSQ